LGRIDDVGSNRFGLNENLQKRVLLGDPKHGESSVVPINKNALPSQLVQIALLQL
jgi:hypothetical protein